MAETWGCLCLFGGPVAWRLDGDVGGGRLVDAFLMGGG